MLLPDAADVVAAVVAVEQLPLVCCFYFALAGHLFLVNVAVAIIAVAVAVDVAVTVSAAIWRK